MDIDEKIISDAKFRVSAYRHASPNNFPKPSSVTSHPQPFQDPYSMSMKERLEQYSVLKAHTGSSYTWGSIGNHYLNTSPPAGHVAWRSTPERENFGRPLNPSPPWAPINSPKIGGSDPPAVDPLLSAIPHLTKGDRYPPCSFAEFKRGNQDPLKRYFNGNGTIHKRRKVEYEPCIPQGLVGIHQYSNVVVAHTPSEAHQVPARPNEPIIPSPRETVPSSKPQDRSGERSEYTHEEREAVFALLSMHQGLSDDPGTASRNAKRLRAKSI